jgi:tripartite-type tricarboxylate transporter receptor subunit TctC
MIPRHARPSRRHLLQLVAALSCLGTAGALHAQAAWPSKSIRAVVGFAAGGGVDVMTRTLAQPLGEALGQTIVVDNKPGGSGNIAAVDVIRSAGDGYTLLVAPTTQETVNPSILKASPNATRELMPVAIIGRHKLHLVVRNDLPVKSVKELVELARSQPGKLTYASSGPGTSPHLLAELFLQQTGTQILHVPYRGSAPAMQAVLAGEADMVFDPGLTFPHVRAGKARMLAVASNKRPVQFPDTPTLTEAGVPGTEFDAWTGIWVPVGTPSEVIQRLSRTIAQVLTQPAVRKRFEDINAEPLHIDTAEFRELLNREKKLMTTLISERKITLD